MARLLILGFSNTGLSTGYTTPLREAFGATHPNLEIRVCGLGGLGPQVVPVVFERMHRLHGPFTHVILEIATSVYARVTTDSAGDAEQLIRDCLNRVAETGASPALLHLLRTDLDATRIPFTRMLTEFATAHGYPVLDLAEGLVRRRGGAFAHGLLRDTVHTTPQGSLYQAEQVAAALGDWLRTAPTPTVPSRPDRRRLALPLAPLAADRGSFQLRDLACDTARLTAGETLAVDLPEPRWIYGLTFVHGPRAGLLEIGLGDRTLAVQVYDEHCFYVRLGARVLHPTQQGLRRQVTLRQDPAMPDVALRRGDPDRSPREANAIDLLYLG